MTLKLMYITNNPEVAEIAQNYGVDRIWIDMEYKGKDERQKGLDTVKNHHTVQDIRNVRPVINSHIERLCRSFLLGIIQERYSI
mgnify:CR=1 FL=1